MMGLFSGITKAIGSIGGFLSGLGPAAPLIGAGLDFLGGRADRRAQEQFARSGLGWRIEDGARYGLHPLASAGAAGGPQFQPVFVPGTYANAFGQTADNYANRGLQKKNAELMDAQIAEARSRTLLNLSNARRGDLATPSSVTGATGGIEQLLQAFDSRYGGGERGIRVEPQPDLPARQTVTLGKYSAVGPNPEAFEVGIGELIAGAAIYGPQWLNAWLRDKGAARPGTGPRRRSRNR